MSTDLATTTDIETITSRDYTAEQVDTGLAVLAMNGGSGLRASEQLAQQGVRIPKATLLNWKNVAYPKRYQHHAQRLAREIEPVIAATLREVALRAGRASIEAVELAETQIRDGSAKDAAGTARNLATVTGIMTDKLMLLEGRPTQTVQHNVQHDLKILERFGVIDSTAEEVKEGSE